MFGSFAKATGPTSIAFVSQACAENGGADEYGLAKQIAPVVGCRSVTKKDMLLNDLTPNIDVDPETFEVTVDGQIITCEPASVLPLAQRYSLF